MRTSGVITILLTALLVISFACTALAESAPPDAEAAPSASEPALPIENLDFAAVPSAAVPTDEPDADASAEVLPTGTEPSETPEPTEEPSPSPDASAAEPTEAPAPSTVAGDTDPSPALNNKPRLEIAYSTMYLHQESPSAQILWKNSVPASVAGYIWSIQPAHGASMVFYVTYDRASTTLAAGALNGHVDAPGTYVLQCQPVGEDQEPVTEPASADLTVESSSLELSITADRPFPVPVGGALTLTANISGRSADQVAAYEWKPSSGSSGQRTCRISSITAGPTRYTCTAVLRSGERVTGTIVATGTELTCHQHLVTLGSGCDALDVVWSNGAPEESDIRYRWSVQGVPGVDLSARSGMSLALKYLTDLPGRDNPYTVTCQAFSGSRPISSPAVFHVRTSGALTAAPAELREMKRIMGDENGKVPNTNDIPGEAPLIALCAAAGVLLTGALSRGPGSRRHI